MKLNNPSLSPDFITAKAVSHGSHIKLFIKFRFILKQILFLSAIYLKKSAMSDSQRYTIHIIQNSLLQKNQIIKIDLIHP